jgi:hypothetical protein
MLLSNHAMASAIYIAEINCQKNYASKIEEIFHDQYQIPKELIETECVESCHRWSKNKKPVHLCINHLDELVILNWNNKFVERSLKIFKSIEQ